VSEGKIDPKRPWVSFDAQLNPHTRDTPTVRPVTGVDAADQLKGPSAGDKVSSITKLKRE
jgi:hypothetical protein